MFFEYVEIGKFCFDSLVLKYEELFGKQNQTYNNHVIRHLPDFEPLYGSLDYFSSLPFERF